MLILNLSNFMIQLVFIMNQLDAYIFLNQISPKLKVHLFIYDQMTWLKWRNKKKILICYKNRL